MFQRKVKPLPLMAWLIVAMSAPCALLAGKDDWLGLVIAVMFAGTFCWAVTGKATQNAQTWEWYCSLQYVFLILTLAAFAGWSQDAWPTGRDFPIVPLTLLFLAVLASYRGAQGACRVSSVLFWLIAALYGILLSFGSKDLEAAYLMPAYGPVNMQSFFILLIPAVMQFIPRDHSQILRWSGLAVGTVFVILALWTTGGLSAPVAKVLDWPFYEAGKSVGVLGIAERLESLISVAVTVGFFSLYSLFLSATGHLAENVRHGWGGKGVVAAGVTAAVLTCIPVRIPAVTMVTFGILLWGILPAVAGGFTVAKKE